MMLNTIKVHAFTKSPTGGNPAGVVIDPPYLTDTQMQWITSQLSVSETAFIHTTQNKDYITRFFSPVTEVDLCGHATIAAFYTLAIKKMIPFTPPITLARQKTNVGILPIEIRSNANNSVKIMMTQSPLRLEYLTFSWKEIAQILNIPPDEIDTTLPKQKISTGLFTLPICLYTMTALKKIHPHFPRLKEFCLHHNIGSIHVFTFETIESSSTYHARNFAPIYGINEDPVTGTANGAVTAFLHHHNRISSTTHICEQGDIINQSGRVHIELEKNQIRVGGTATIIKEINLPVP